MPIDILRNKADESAFNLTNEPPVDASSTRPLLSRISTAARDGDGSAVPVRPAPYYPSFGAVVEGLSEEEEALWVGEAGSFKAASAPERTSAFPHDGSALDGSLALSPAQSFLSMFLSPPSIPSEELDSVAGYSFIETIGHGGFSVVKKASSPSGEVVAVKIVKNSDIDGQDDPDEARRQMNTEIDIWGTLNHEHILPLFHAEHTPNAHYIVTLYCPAGSLFDILKRDGNPALPQDDAGMMFRQVVRGLRYLHESAKVIHRDIKLENVLVDEAGMCRIGDFGFAKRMQDDTSNSYQNHTCQCHGMMNENHERLRRHSTVSHAKPTYHVNRRQPGTARHRKSTPFGNSHDVPPPLTDQQFQPGSLPYASPELLSPPSLRCGIHPHVSPSSPAQDMWALGVLLYALLTGVLPFWDSFEPRLQMKILNGTYDIPPGIGNGAERVLRGCLDTSAFSRWTIAMVDEVAWGIGWGSAGDVSGLPSASPDASESNQDLRRSKSRSQSRSRPYPEHPRGRASQPLHSRTGIPSEEAISNSFSRSRTRGSRGRSFDREPPLSPAMSQTYSSSTTDSSNSYVGPNEELRLRTHSRSESQSRSRSWSLGPATPPTKTVPFSFSSQGSAPSGLAIAINNRRPDASQKSGENRISAISEASEEDTHERGRRREISRKEDLDVRAAGDDAGTSSLDQQFLRSLGAG